MVTLVPPRTSPHPTHSRRSRRNAPTRLRPSRSRRGVTLVEAVLASLLLAMVALSVANAVSYVMSEDGRQRRILGAYEAAHQIMLAYLLDPTGFETMRAKPYDDVEPWRFVWDIAEDKAVMTLPERLANPNNPNASSDRSNPASGGPGRNLPMDRFRYVTIRVYEELPGQQNQRGQLLATLSRFVDPTSFARNPDSMQKLMSDPAYMQRMISEMRGGAPGSFPSDPRGFGRDAGQGSRGNAGGGAGGAGGAGGRSGGGG